MKYRDAGVNIDHGNQLVERIKHAASTTLNKQVLGTLGGFGALYDIASLSCREPVLVAGTDGVGTKIKLAIEMQVHDTIGIDLVAMCVNDLLVQGARPLFFLDYFACSRLDIEITSTVIEGIARGCRTAGCALIGGETAEMPDMYQPGDYDLAGFCVGMVDRNEIIDGSRIEEGDVLIGIASNGPHSNGYSLIRKILSETNTHLNQPFADTSYGEILLQPTKIYTTTILPLIDKIPIKGLVHITGGGLIDNIPRVLPNGLTANINTRSWDWPPIFNWLSKQGDIENFEMYRTFNCGIGMIACVSKNDLDEAIEYLQQSGETAWELGTIVRKEDKIPVVNLIEQ